MFKSYSMLKVGLYLYRWDPFTIGIRMVKIESYCTLKYGLIHT